MAKSSRVSSNSRSKRDEEEDLDLDEIDQFHKDQDEILLDQAGLKSRGKNVQQFELSDEEVLGLSNDEDEEDEEMDDEALYGVEGDENEDEEGWGTSKNNYYGADEPQDEDDAKQEEEEALRLQKAHLADLAEDDYYEDEDVDEWKRTAKATEEEILTGSGVHHEALPDQDPTLLNDTEKLNLLKNWYPEVIPFVGELQKYSSELEVLKKVASDSENSSIKFAALSLYLGTLSAYFALFVGTIDKGKVNLKDHDVVKGILKARELWRLAKDLEDEDQEESFSVKKNGKKFKKTAVNSISSDSAEDDTVWQSASEGLDSDEEEEIISNTNTIKRKRELEPTANSDSDSEFSIQIPIISKPAKKKSRKSKSDYREDDTIDQVDLADKQARKKSLRFYTSKIDQQDIKSTNVREKFSGDIDLPYKERHFERQQRLMEEARKRGLKTSNGNYDPTEDFGSDNENDHATAKSINDAFGDDYYNTVKSASIKRKEDKKASHTLALAAAKEGRLGELAAEQNLADGDKRAINYQILKNKGLTPKRNKDNRNSRVKKRKKYEAAKKKLPSVRQVYKAPTTSYQGEQTGIKKNIIRSVRFAN